MAGGSEKIIHSFHLAMELSETDKFAIDAVNAFNSGNKFIGLGEIGRHVKEVLPYMLAMYGSDPKCWYYGLGDEIKPILAEEGFTQGDVMATWAFIMTIQPFLVGLDEILGGDGNFAKFFVDDGNLCADFDKMVEAIDYILRVGPKYGYIMSLIKGSYLLGKCGKVLALERRQILVDKFGMLESVIHFHPDDVDDEDKQGAALEYGMKILGAYVGTDEFTKHKLVELSETLVETAGSLKKVTTLQSRFLLLKNCFCPKIIHVLRTTRPSLTCELIATFENLKREIFCSILSEQPDFLSDLKWEQWLCNL